MKRFFARLAKVLLWLGGALAVMAALVVLAAMLTMPEWLGHVNLVIDGERFDLSDMSSSQVLALGLSLALAALVIPLVVVLALLFSALIGLGLPFLVVGAVAVGLTALCALVLSPLLLAGWLLWWLLKPSASASTPATTIGA